MPDKLSAIVLAGNGANCERETAHGCRIGGFHQVDIVTVWELVDGEVDLGGYDLLCLAGGFLDGDDLGSAKAQANRLRYSRIRTSNEPVIDAFLRFIADGKLVLGICNGFQLMVKLGLLPGFDGEYTTQVVTLTHNDSGRFEDRWVWLRANRQTPCVFTRGMDTAYFPVRHGEGKFVAKEKDVLTRLKGNNQVVFHYMDPSSGSPTISYPDNPNGSQHAIAGICDPSGRVFGMMPHPEAYLHRTNHPRWTREELPEEGMGVRLFINAFEYLNSRT
ncbi:MAG: phosphoribosylformylglycinamidine synthase subunit PurQ [Chitinivibrionales bacterium]|nr:phosphoribosylformylglycinamidine synthase subunit PurQ [Chitinivibrionales bacterium]MBD3395484.1 phosphoribosylformylglycinamidine synthase subunit PurQ [Chitinivibrionales bacterium]